MAVFAGALGLGELQIGLGTLQGVVEHRRLTMKELVVLRLTHQRGARNLMCDIGQVILPNLVEQRLRGVDPKHPQRI
ncbi:Uncharacterised protein [Mycobacteroides abscessus subsp. abscessus]|nr:Uncharacterised protein [Mycobacteroides abscessus subsp. abscessus]SHY83528.1 Uncharacterised protein [Mycobacteroides abscessus subsp. abscessus]